MGLCLLGARPRLHPKRKEKKGKKRKRRRNNPFIVDEAEEASDQEEEEEEEGEDEQEEEEQQECGEEGGEEMELLYGLTERNSGARIKNLLQLSAGILSWSKVIFYDKIAWMLEVLDMAKAEIAYLDTDSVVVAAVSPNFEDCLLPHMRRKYEREKHRIFADPEAQLAPNGLLKEEFKVSLLLRCLETSSDGFFQGDQAIIRALKMYFFENSETSQTIVRVKGASMQTHSALSREDFGQNMDRPLYANRYKLAATRGHDMSISMDSRKIITAFNSKRRCEVS